MQLRIIALDEAAIMAQMPALARLLVDSVAGGAAVSFMAPLSEAEASRFWWEDVRPEVVAGRRMLFGAEREGALLGTVQLILAMPPNQPHRCEIAKMLVLPRARRQGIGRALMLHALDCAHERGKTLATLDTRTGDIAEPLYRSVGFAVAGVIPDYAWDPDGGALHAATVMFRRL